MFLFGWAGSPLPCGFLLVVASLVAGSRCAGFSSCSLQALGHSLRTCGAQAQLLCGTWGLPGLGNRPMSTAWAGRRILYHWATREAPPYDTLNALWYKLGIMAMESSLTLDSQETKKCLNTNDVNKFIAMVTEPTGTCLKQILWLS